MECLGHVLLPIIFKVADSNERVKFIVNALVIGSLGVPVFIAGRTLQEDLHITTNFRDFTFDNGEETFRIKGVYR